MIALIDYGSGDIEIIAKTLADLKLSYIVTNNEFDILKSDRIILPDIADILYAIKQLHKNNLFTMLRVCKKPILGIDTGMQLLADHFKENNISGMGIIPETVEKFNPEISKFPFTGFIEIEIKTGSKILNGIEKEAKLYFDNSHYLPINIYTSSVADNNTAFSASVETRNYYGVQFHPEKSGEAGLSILKNFISL